MTDVETHPDLFPTIKEKTEMKPEDRKRLKQHIEMIVEHKEPTQTEKILRDAVATTTRGEQ